MKIIKKTGGYSTVDSVSLYSVVLPSGLKEIETVAFLEYKTYYGKHNPDLSLVDMHRATKLKKVGMCAFCDAIYHKLMNFSLINLHLKVYMV